MTLCKKLRRLEIKAHQVAEDWCNGGIETDDINKHINPIMEKVRKVLNINNSYPMSPDDNYPITFNGDARGYALKIADSFVNEHHHVIFKDWGGYGILAPEFDGN